MAKKPTYAELERQVSHLRNTVAGLERAEEMNQTLYRVSSAVNTTTNLEELYASIHEILNNVIALRNFYIAIYHRDTRSISFPYSKDEFDDRWDKIEDFTETNSLTGEVILAGEPLLFDRKMLLERAGQDRIRGTTPLVWMGFPLKVKGAVIGVMATQSYSDPHQFSQRDFETLTSVSDQIAIAIERKRIAEALQESETRFRSMAEALPCAIYRCFPDAEWTMAYISRQIQEISGYPATDFIDNAVRSFASIIHPEDAGIVDRRVRAALDAKESWAIEYRIFHADGSIRSVYEEGRAIYADNDRQRVLDGFILDHSERRRAEKALQLSEATYREIFNTVNDTIWVHDIDTFKFIDVNNKVTEMFGYAIDEALDLNLEDISAGVAPFTKETGVDRLERARGGESQLFEWYAKHKDGHLFWTEVSLKRATIAGKDCLLAIERDITERRKADDSLRRSEERYRTLLEASPDAIVAYDPKGQIIYINPAFTKTYGWTAAELSGRKIDFVPEHEKEKTQRAVMRNLDGEDVSLETQRLTKDGRLLDIHLKTAIFNDDRGKFQGSIVIHRDITERRKTEAERERLIAIIENTSDMVSSALPDGRLLYVNQAGRKMVGWAEDEPLIDKTISAVHPAAALKVIRTVGIPTAIENGVWNGQTALLDGQGNDFVVSQVIMSHKGPDGRIEYLSTIMRDITASIEAEQETRRLQNLLGNIVDSMPSILVGIDDTGRVTQWNRRAEKETGIKAPDAAGRMLDNVFPRLASEMETIRAAMGDRQPKQDLKRLFRDTAGTRYEDVTVYPLTSNGIEGAVIRVDDVTERVRLEEMMIQSEKMMSVGGLAAGMAHEINNPLAGIMQNTQIARNRLSGASPADRRAAEACGTTIETIKAFHEKRGLIPMLESALASGARAARIVNNMLSFSRMGDTSMAKQDLAALLDNTVELAQSDYDLKRKYDFRKIKIVRDYDPATPPVTCAGSKIQQVFLNIFKNGAAAMAGHANRAESSQFTLRVRPGKEVVRVEIQDNGPGMTAAVRKRIFEPFYTTKSGAGGTGLGLSVSYFIITDNHGGSMTVESEPGKGARFIIQLPA